MEEDDFPRGLARVEQVGGDRLLEEPLTLDLSKQLHRAFFDHEDLVQVRLGVIEDSVWGNDFGLGLFNQLLQLVPLERLEDLEFQQIVCLEDLLQIHYNHEKQSCCNLHLHRKAHFSGHHQEVHRSRALRALLLHHLLQLSLRTASVHLPHSGLRGTVVVYFGRENERKRQEADGGVHRHDCGRVEAKRKGTCEALGREVQGGLDEEQLLPHRLGD